MEILIASQNKGKIREFQELLTSLGYEVIGLVDIGLGEMEVEETGTTFEENALLKARAYGEASGKLAVADDSGLVVDALEGRPGVYSARYGNVPSEAGRRAYLLNEMKDIPEAERSAHFISVIAVYDPKDGQSYTIEGRVDGQILFEERDSGQGFGYDSLFLPDGFSQSFGEMSAEEKHKISHRGRAVAKLPELLRKIR
jgi:non-canonical purine NTP pyrophosphatase (RdgB/HAM1 family)